jgi:hypothetical protein
MRRLPSSRICRRPEKLTCPPEQTADHDHQLTLPSFLIYSVPDKDPDHGNFAGSKEKNRDKIVNHSVLRIQIRPGVLFRQIRIRNKNFPLQNGFGSYLLSWKFSR